MDPLACLHLQMRLEGKVLVNEFFMRQVEMVPDEEMPLMLIAQLANEEFVAYYDEAISIDLQKELAANLPGIEFPEIDRLFAILKSHHLHYEVGHYKTYLFPVQPSENMKIIRLSKHDPMVKMFGFDGFAENIYAIERDGAVVSACVSTRENEKCGEAWVYTDDKYRNQGMAQKVVRAWAGNLMDEGKVPFYSHKISNKISARLARKLGLQPVFEEIAISQI
jgi:RimJ/RimL family protein N-acetyltransferase